MAQEEQNSANPNPALSYLLRLLPSSQRIWFPIRGQPEEILSSATKNESYKQAQRAAVV